MEVLGYIVGAIVLIIAFLKLKSKGTKLPESVPPAVTRWKLYAIQAANEFELPWQIVLAQIWQESTGNPNAVGSSGEIGLMQLKQIALDDLKLFGYGNFEGWQDEPPVNIRAGAAFLDLQRTRSGGLIHSALAEVRATALESYNEGYEEAKQDLGPDEYAQEVLAKAKVLGYER